MSAIQAVLDYYGIDYKDGSAEQSIHCPVHDDTTKSASLNLDKEVFNCFACGASGSAYDIVMIREGLDFASSVRFVEKTTGITNRGTREEPRTRAPVPRGTGYLPRFRKKLQARSRQRLKF